ncbi:MAG: prephenate dehydratase [Anaerolineae bacterium]|nr:prephenate dehydratase [Anaerolineae bacterium]
MITKHNRKVYFQGEYGAYSEEAAYEYFGSKIETRPCPTFNDVFQDVSDHDNALGLLPIENSLAGSIHRNYDLLLRYDLSIVGEYYFRVSHCLLALPDVKIGSLRRVHSHPQALAQCEKNLTNLGVEKIPEADTAGSARMLRSFDDPHAAALASRRAADVYDLKILAENFEDNPANYTRFLCLSRNRDLTKNISPSDYKTSAVFSLDNRPGALFRALGVFALRDIDLTKIESRPLVGKPGDYLFYVDFVGHINSPNIARAIEHLSEMAPFLRVFGSYPRHEISL